MSHNGIHFVNYVSFPRDTDVFLLLIHYYNELPTRTKFITGKVNARRSIDIGKAFEALRSEKRAALLGFHAFTGCDQTSKFNGNSKLTCWKVFNDSQSDIISAFKDLGSEISIDSAVAPFKRFVMKLFSSNIIKVTSDETLNTCRWKLYTKFQNCDKLPPTSSALKYKILRSHLICSIWKSADKKHPVELDVLSYGWERNEDGLLVATMTDKPPAPEAIIEIRFCKCGTGCNNMRCKCKKNQLICTELCFCKDCENDNDNNHLENEEDNDSDDEC